MLITTIATWNTQRHLLYMSTGKHNFSKFKLIFIKVCLTNKLWWNNELKMHDSNIIICAALKKTIVKKDVKSKVVGKTWLANGTKNFNNDNSGEFVLLSPHFTGIRNQIHRIVLIKILPLVYHHSHFLAATLDFTSYFHNGFLQDRTLFRFHFLFLHTV